MSQIASRKFRGRQLAAARALAGMMVRDLESASGVHKSTLVRLEAMDLIEVTPLKRHGYVAARTWDAIATALLAAGVELTPETADCGAGVRWSRPHQPER